jgi:putative nucleotidyltransferase with HDIG domain
MQSPVSSCSRPWSVYAYVATVIGLGAAVVAWSAYDLAAHGTGMLLPVLLVITLATGMAKMRIPDMPISFSISDSFIIIAALLVGPSAGAVVAALDGVVITLRMERENRQLHRALFNMAASAIAPFAAAHLFLTLSGGHPVSDGPLGAIRLIALLTVFGAVTFTGNSGIVAGVLALEKGTSIAQVFREHFVGLWLTTFGGVFTAMLLMVLRRGSALEVLILIAPLPLILYVTYRQAVGRSEDKLAHLGKINKVYVAAIEALSHAVDTKDQVTSDHTRRVQERSEQLARRLGVTDEMEIQAVKAASLLHDVGKIGIPEHILNKPGRLTPSEYDIMKRHAPMGAEILSMIGFPYPVVPIVRHHHENWDGTGYPDKIAGEQIPIGARILSVVDCFDALTSDRPYRPRLPDEQALEIVRQRRGTMYDPRIVDEFFAMRAEETGEVAAPVEVAASEVAFNAAIPVAASQESSCDGNVLEMFFQLGAELTATMRSQDAGRIVWHHVAPHLPPGSFVLFGYDRNGDALVPLFRSDERVVRADTRIALGERLSGWVAATRETIVNSDARLDQDESCREEQPLLSALAVPVVRGDRVIAVVAVYAEAAGAFTPAHRHIAEAAARSIAPVPLELAGGDVVAAENAA